MTAVDDSMGHFHHGMQSDAELPRVREVSHKGDDCTKCPFLKFNSSLSVDRWTSRQLSKSVCRISKLPKLIVGFLDSKLMSYENSRDRP